MKDHCPRCLSPWKQVIQGEDCCLTECGMRRLGEVAANKGPTFLCDSIIKQGDFLVWYTGYKYCRYYGSLHHSNSIKLPYLKFDIEAPKLKLYLTFS